MNATPFPLIFTPVQLEEARGWIGGCVWRDIQDAAAIDALTPRQVEQGIERHYTGGRRQFIIDESPHDS